MNFRTNAYNIIKERADDYLNAKTKTDKKTIIQEVQCVLALKCNLDARADRRATEVCIDMVLRDRINKDDFVNIIN